MTECKVEQWRDIKDAPRDREILYKNKSNQIGFCYWSKAGGVFDKDMWYDEVESDEVVPTHWLPRDVLPPFPDGA